MSKSFGKAGSFTRRLAEWRSIIRTSLVLLILIVGIVFLRALPTTHGLSSLGAIIAMIVMFWLIARIVEKGIDTKVKEERCAIRGAVGEEKVGALLGELDDTHVVFHDVETPFGNIDHVVLSQAGGLIVIETKSHAGRVTKTDAGLAINGRPPEKDFIRQTLSNTMWLRGQVAEQLGVTVWVSATLVFTNAFVERFAPIRGVAVINRRFLKTWISREKNASAEKLWDQREAIAELLTTASSLRAVD